MVLTGACPVREIAQDDVSINWTAPSVWLITMTQHKLDCAISMHRINSECGLERERARERERERERKGTLVVVPWTPFGAEGLRHPRLGSLGRKINAGGIVVCWYLPYESASGVTLYRKHCATSSAVLLPSAAAQPTASASGAFCASAALRSAVMACGIR